ncbi:unnamed protein product, partial [Ectocarpus sp. 13 AM-2016]
AVECPRKSGLVPTPDGDGCVSRLLEGVQLTPFAPDTLSGTNRALGFRFLFLRTASSIAEDQDSRARDGALQPLPYHTRKARGQKNITWENGNDILLNNPLSTPS